MWGSRSRVVDGDSAPRLAVLQVTPSERGSKHHLVDLAQPRSQRVITLREVDGMARTPRHRLSFGRPLGLMADRCRSREDAGLRLMVDCV